MKAVSTVSHFNITKDKNYSLAFASGVILKIFWEFNVNVKMYVIVTRNAKKKINDFTWASVVHKQMASFERMEMMKLTQTQKKV